MSQSTPPRAYSPAHFALELGQNEIVGFPISVEGGNLKSEIMTYESGSSRAIWRQLSKPKAEDLKFEIGLAASQVFYDWIAAFIDGEVVRKDGCIVSGDFHYNERTRRNFLEALISEVAFPKCDANDRSACHMTVTLAPELMEFEVASGNQKIDHKVGKNMAQKLWTAANFRFEIDGFEDSCRRVMQVDGFSIKQKILEYPAGNLRQPIRVPGPIEWPNLTFYVPEVDAKPFIDHFKKTVIQGEPQNSSRMTGTLEYLDHEGMELAEMHIEGIDIASITHDKSSAGAEEIKKVKIEISVEKMKFEYGDQAVLE